MPADQGPTKQRCQKHQCLPMCQCATISPVTTVFHLIFHLVFALIKKQWAIKMSSRGTIWTAWADQRNQLEMTHKNAKVFGNFSKIRRTGHNKKLYTVSGQSKNKK